MFFLQNKGFILSSFLDMVLASVGTLLMFLQNMRTNFEYETKVKTCIEKGLHIKKKHDYSIKLFSIFENNKLVAYCGNLLSRPFPADLIVSATGEAAVLSAVRIGMRLVIAIAIFSVVALYVAVKLYVKISGKILLND